VGASVQGPGHQRKGQPCQDAHRWQVIQRDLLVAVVADGAGSASCSDLGAALATQTAVTTAVDHLQKRRPSTEAAWHSLLQIVFTEARAAIVEYAETLELDAAEFATTLLVALATPDYLAVGQIGDGAVVARLRDGSFEAVTCPVREEFINETTFLTSPECADQAQWMLGPRRITGLALLSDGLQMLALKMPQGQPHPAFFGPLFNLCEVSEEWEHSEARLQTFLQSPPIAQRADDDVTLILAVREE
jgi:hypothetical protein